MNMEDLKPPIGAKTRWAGIIPMLKWMNENSRAIMEYDGRHPKDCVVLEDGTEYGDHVMSFEEWDVLRQLVSLIFCVDARV